MDYELSDDLKQMQEATRLLVQDLLKYEPEFHQTGKVPHVVNEALADLGLYGVAIPEKFGGLGLGPFSTSVIQAELGRLPSQFWGPLRILMGGPGSNSIVKHGSTAQKEKWLPHIVSGKCVVAFALTEPESGSDASRMRTTATRNADGWVINGNKTFISNAQHADLIMVFARTDPEKGIDGISTFLVNPKNPGFRVVNTIPTMGVTNGGLTDIVFEECQVSEEDIIGEQGKGFRYALESLNEGRLNVGASGVGMGELALEESISFAKQRMAHGKPIASFQAIQHMLADMAIDMYAARQMLMEAAWQLEYGTPNPSKCSMVKVFCAEAAFRTADTALQIHGGTGYCTGIPVERIFRDVRSLRLYEGTSEVQRNFIARNLLKD